MSIEYIISGIKLVSLYSTIKMMHGPINIRFTSRSPLTNNRTAKTTVLKISFNHEK